MVCEEKELENQYRAISALNVAVCSLCTPLVALYCALLSYDAVRMVTVCGLHVDLLNHPAAGLHQLHAPEQAPGIRCAHEEPTDQSAGGGSRVDSARRDRLHLLGLFRRDDRRPNRYVGPYEAEGRHPRTGRVPLAYYRSLLSRERDFIINQTPSNIAYQVRSQLPTLIIGSLFGTTVLAARLLNRPEAPEQYRSHSSGSAVGNVFYQRIASMREDVGAIARFVQRNMRRTMLVAIARWRSSSRWETPSSTSYSGSGYELGGAMVGVIGFQSLFSFLTASIKGGRHRAR